MWVAQLPHELYDTWMSAKGGDPLGTLEFALDDAAAGAGESGKATITVVDENGRWTYAAALVPMQQEDLRVVMSEEASEPPRYAMEGVVEQKALVQPCEGRKALRSKEAGGKAPKKKKKKQDRKQMVVISHDDPLASVSADLPDAPLAAEVTSTTRRAHKVRGDRKEVKDRLLGLMAERPQWTRQELVDRLDQPADFVDEIASEVCDRVELQPKPGEPFKRKMVYQLKAMYLNRDL